MATTADLEKGKIIKHNGELYTVIERAHHKPGKGVTVVRSRLKNLATGAMLEHTFKSGEIVEFPETDRKKLQYLYSDANGSYFMDMATYEQMQIPVKIMDGREKYFRESEEATVLYYENRPINIEMPIKVKLRVVEAPPAVKGDTASGNVSKEVKLETGLTVNAPMFIKEGDEIVINTEKGEYVERG
ncbi:MAG: elongation factor P [Parcubacteria group bacterium CG10_big_fil_rev_8_21_14_0_10_36_14]|nr:MAG: elongation factor P [Parcubacteria group bacterium CG10_big_fil_rev_8_21_14_0_10_36_14]